MTTQYLISINQDINAAAFLKHAYFFSGSHLRVLLIATPEEWALGDLGPSKHSISEALSRASLTLRALRQALTPSTNKQQLIKWELSGFDRPESYFQRDYAWSSPDRRSVPTPFFFFFF